MNNRLLRVEYLVGQENINKLIKAKVAIIGLGGVGATAAIALARTGIGNIIIQDYDIINETNFNRQIHANIKTLNSKKTDVLKEMILNINPECNVISIDKRFEENSDLFNHDFDYLIDAIDSVEDKIQLIKKCINEKIIFVSSMGTAKKMDIRKLEIIELSKTTYDPLAKIIRRRLIKDNIKSKIMVLSSTEEVCKGPLLGSYMPVTSTAGLMLADYIIKKIME